MAGFHNPGTTMLRKRAPPEGADFWLINPADRKSSCSSLPSNIQGIVPNPLIDTDRSIPWNLRRFPTHLELL
jgi:hypothetical protein